LSFVSFDTCLSSSGTRASRTPRFFEFEKLVSGFVRGNRYVKAGKNLAKQLKKATGASNSREAHAALCALR
jgi:hypothetical protein